MVILQLLVLFGVSYLLGRLFQKFKLPAILGWLCSGMFIGPNGLHWVTQSFLEIPAIVFILIVFETLAGSLVGFELQWEDLKKSGKQLLIITGFQSIFTFIAVSIIFSLVLRFMGLPLYMSLIFGGIACATAPAPSISIVKEFKAKGPVTDTLLPLAAIDDVIAIIIFFTLNAIVYSLTSGSTFSLMPMFLMICVPVFLGIGYGLFSAFIIRKAPEKYAHFIYLVFTVFIALSGMFLMKTFDSIPSISYFLAGLAYAACIGNTIGKKRMDYLIHKVDPILNFALIPLVFSMGAPLDVRMIPSSGILTFVYIGSRMFGKYFGSYLGSRIAHAPDTVRKYLGLTLLPHSGVSLFFTTIIVTTLLPVDPQTAKTIQATIAGAAILNEIMAVFIAKKGFQLAQEIDA